MKDNKIGKSLICIFLASIFISKNIFALSINIHEYRYRKYSNEILEKLNDNLIEYDEIEDMVFKYNPSVLSMWNSYEGNKDSNEIYEDYMEAYDSLISAASGMESDATAASLYAQAEAMKELADNNINDSEISFMKIIKKKKK